MKNEKIRISMLCDIYGALLSDKQRNALDLYCNEDLSLSEIAENTGISRQGVRDQLTHAEAQLTFYEEKLALLEKYTEISEILAQIDAAKDIQSNDTLFCGLQKIRTILNLE